MTHENNEPGVDDLDARLCRVRERHVRFGVRSLSSSCHLSERCAALSSTLARWRARIAARCLGEGEGTGAALAVVPAPSLAPSSRRVSFVARKDQAPGPIHGVPRPAGVTRCVEHLLDHGLPGDGEDQLKWIAGP